MEGLLFFLCVMCLSLVWTMRKTERLKQLDENMEGTYRVEKHKKKLKIIDRFTFKLSRAGFPIQRIFVPYLLIVFGILVGFILSLRLDSLGYFIGFILSPFLFDRLLSFFIGLNVRRFMQDFELSLDVGGSIIRAHGTLKDYVEESQKLVDSGWFYREIKKVKERLNHSVPVEQAFQEMADRVDLEAIHYAAQALKSSSQGVNMAAVFDDIRMMINRSLGAERKAKSQTTELRRMALLLISLPFIVGLMFKSTLLELIQSQPNIILVILLVIGANCIGGYVTWKAVRIRV